MSLTFPCLSRRAARAMSCTPAELADLEARITRLEATPMPRLPAYDREALAAFQAALRARHGLTDPEPVTTRPRPTLTAADGTPEPPLPTTIPEEDLR
ncbi:hypothetical protein V3N95_03845 [Micrococcaceae bacterium Sec6.3]